ncbi:MAG: FAD-dependent oxidoreductase [Halieaceae bacterium]|jgi:glycine/D-amino acid oxidase-like deaminating enzyme|nr:FAD-dependent oxidoreductase [Halieaceae bacterium]
MASSAALPVTKTLKAASSNSGFDAIVVGAGVFGAWTAWSLHQTGLRVALIDKAGPAHTRASSGGESRVTRSGYGDDDHYADWAHRSLDAWQRLSARAGLPIFHPLGVLWIHQEGDPMVTASASSLDRLGIPFEMLTRNQLEQRYPVAATQPGDAGFLEPRGGGIMARRAIQTLVNQAADDGLTVMQGEVRPLNTGDSEGGSLPKIHVRTRNGDETLSADSFVMACGPWLDTVCPDAMAGRLFVTRQEVFYFAAGSDVSGSLPVWADLPFYGFPDLESRGFKVANDTHGPIVNPDTQSREASDGELERVREFLSVRFPAIAEKPLTESRVCQYENSSNGDFVVDRHPGLDNVWLVGGGSGHGFKHGPALGAHVADLVLDRTRPIARFSLASKERRQARDVY